MNVISARIEPECEDAQLPERCESCEIRQLSLCGQVDRQGLDGLSKIARNERIAAGRTLIWEGEASDVVGIVRNGLFKLSASLEDGREQTLGLAFPGDFVGRPFAAETDHSVIALTDSMICIFNRTRFEAVARDLSQIEHALLTNAFKDLDRARRWMVMLGRKSASERVASLLVETAERSEAKSGEPVPLPLSRQQMGDVLGLTIETVSRKMHQFARNGVIGLPNLRSFTVERASELARLAA